VKAGIAGSAALIVLGVAAGDAVIAQPIYSSPPPGYIVRPPGFIGPPAVHVAPPPGYVPFRPRLSRNAIAARVRAAGLTPVSRPLRLDPRRYGLFAVDAAGQRLHVVVDGYGGRILRVGPAHAMPRVAGGYPPPHMPPRGVVPLPPHAAPPTAQREIKDPPPGVLPPRDAYTGSTPPPRTPPNAQFAAVPRASNAASPAATARPRMPPLPRPRPAVAANVSGSEPALAAAPKAKPALQAKPAPKPPAETQPAPVTEAPAKAKPSQPELVPVAPLE
jgi:hypothetical protein